MKRIRDIFKWWRLLPRIEMLLICDISTLNGVAVANISYFDEVSWANIEKINTVVKSAGGGGYMVEEDWESGLGDWSQYDVYDAGSISNFEQSSSNPDAGTYHCRNTVLDTHANVMFHDTAFSSHAAGYIKTLVSLGGTAGSNRVGVIYGMNTGTTPFRYGVIVYLYEGGISLGHFLTNGNRTSDDYQDYGSFAYDTYYGMIMKWDDEDAGETHFYGEMWDSTFTSLLASCDDTITDTYYVAVGGEYLHGLMITNSGGEDDDWGTYIADTGSP